jgi:hypothetical protein
MSHFGLSQALAIWPAADVVRKLPLSMMTNGAILTS